MLQYIHCFKPCLFHAFSWSYFPHEHARSRTYRWGEDGLLGFSDDKSQLCLSLGLWNGKDRMLKERLFGLAGPQVKESITSMKQTWLPQTNYHRTLVKPWTHIISPGCDVTRRQANEGLHICLHYRGSCSRTCTERTS